MEDADGEKEPYSIIIHLKEKSDGHFVYSFEAINEKRTTANLSLYRRGITLTNAESSFNGNIPQSSDNSKQLSLSDLDADYMAAVKAGDMKFDDLLFSGPCQTSSRDQYCYPLTGIPAAHRTKRPSAFASASTLSSSSPSAPYIVI